MMYSPGCKCYIKAAIDAGFRTITSKDENGNVLFRFDVENAAVLTGTFQRCDGTGDETDEEDVSVDSLCERADYGFGYGKYDFE